MNEEEIWRKIKTIAEDYKIRGEPLFRDNYYTLWIRTAGTEAVAITKAASNAETLPPVENDGGRITTFHARPEDFFGFIESYETLEEVDYEYKEWAYKELTNEVLKIDETRATKEELMSHVESILSDSPLSMADLRESVFDSLLPSISDLEKTGHGRKRWATNLQNAVFDLKGEGKIGHLKHNQYISPINCQNPLNPENLWFEIRERAEALYDDEIVCTWENYKHGTGKYFVESVSSEKILFKRDPFCGNQSINQIQFDKKRVLGMTNALNAVGGVGTRVTIGGNRQEYSELLISLSSMIEIDEKQNIMITDTVVDPIVDFDCNKKNSEKALKKRALKPGVQREGATKFRKQVLANYGNKCAISGISVVDTIQAAHIRPYNGPETNHPANGIALRSDIHRLFDLGKIRINPEDLCVYLHPDVESEYRKICSGKLDLEGVPIHPNTEALELMWIFQKNRWF